MKKRSFILLFIVFLICAIVLSSCTGNKEEEKRTGGLIITITQKNKPDFIKTEDYSISAFASKGSESVVKSGRDGIVFKDLEEGTWKIDLLVLDKAFSPIIVNDSFTVEIEEGKTVVASQEQGTVDYDSVQSATIFFSTLGIKDGKGGRLVARDYVDALNASELKALLESDYISSGELNLKKIYDDICSDMKSLAPTKCNSIGYLKFNLFEDGVTSVVLPDSDSLAIDDYAFAGFEALESFDTSNVSSIGGSAFEGCKALTSITLPEGTKSVRNNTFKDCESLATVENFDEVEYVYTGAFDGCKNWAYTENLELEYIGIKAFKDCAKLNITEVDCPEIYSKAFSGCTSLTEISLTGETKRIGEKLFEGCSSLASIDLGSSIKLIDSYAFRGTAISEITIPASVTEVKDFAFDGCTGLIIHTDGCAPVNSWDKLWAGTSTGIVFD